MRNTVDISDMVGKVFASVENKGDEIVFKTADRITYTMYHEQDCCENVSVDDICGELDTIIGVPIVSAEETTNSDNPKDKYDESFTWTFYHFATEKGYVDIRWYGESNGWYSERVDIVREANYEG